MERVAFFGAWASRGAAASPAVFPISAFTFTQALLVRVLQAYARKHGLSLDSVVFSCVVLNSEGGDAAAITRGPDDGCYIGGLHLEGVYTRRVPYNPQF